MLGPSRRELHRQLERERTRNQLRETELINQILYLSGRMWTPPPSDGDEDMEDLSAPAMVSALQLPFADEEDEEG
jgi:hypothetical protein